MLHRKSEKEGSRSKKHKKEQILSPNVLKQVKEKRKSDKKVSEKVLKKGDFRTNSRLHEPSSKGSLFNSLRDLPHNKPKKNHQQINNKKHKKNKGSKHNLEESSTNLDFKQHLKQYNHPNG